MRKKIVTFLKCSGIIFSIGAVVLAVYLFFAVRIAEPAPKDRSIEQGAVTHLDGSLYSFGANRIKKNRDGLWELYVEGDGYSRGVAAGKLSSQLVMLQEQYFVDQIKVMIPSDVYLNMLKVLVAWFNRDLDSYVRNDYLSEIYGVSRSAPDKYDFIGPKFQRMLNYHAAHDIGHMLVNMHLVGCTSFALKGSRTTDGKIIVGRNFDFNMGEDFSRDKIVEFCAPSQGNRFMFITWGGMTGVVSGMNEAGLTVTINAAENTFPGSIATPISMITKEILQYAHTIDEAFAIAKKNKSFVSESILVASAVDKRAVIIEKTPEKTDLYDNGEDLLISTNHFLRNRAPVREESSLYRYERVAELFSKKKRFSVRDAADVLRNVKGKGDADIGIGNEKTVFQMIAHHSILFSPEDLTVWISTSDQPGSPIQLGEYFAYNLKDVFEKFPRLNYDISISANGKNIPASPLVRSSLLKNYKAYHYKTAELKKAISSKGSSSLDDQWFADYLSENPNMYLSYKLSGDYYRSIKRNDVALEYYALAMKKEIARAKERDEIVDLMKECQGK